jgi:hypothetical protein
MRRGLEAMNLAAADDRQAVANREHREQTTRTTGREARRRRDGG